MSGNHGFNIAVLTTFVAIASSFVLFLWEDRASTHCDVGDATFVESSEVHPIHLTKHEFFFSNDEKKWIEAGRRKDVGWLMAFSDLQHDQFSVNQFVHHIQKSPANVLLIDSISDEALEAINQMPRLRALVIHNSNVTNAGLNHLVKMPHLETVGFYYCKVTQEGIEELRQQMPETHFEIHDHSRSGFVFKGTGCLNSSFLETYMKKSSWR